jgi:hypothetical protein
MAKLLAFWGIKYTYWKIIAVVKSTMLKKRFFFGRSIQNYVYFTVTWARNRIAIFFPLNKNVFYTTSGNLRKGSEIWYRLMIEVKVHGIVNTTKSKFFKEYLLFYLLLKSVIFLKSDGQQFHH